MSQPRGIRNNNPLNLRRNATRWQGMSEVQDDPDFCRFVAPQWGYRAAFVTLRSYRTRHGLATLRQWITRWAPPSENDTQGYIAAVCRWSGLQPDSRVDLENDQEGSCSLVAAMSRMENGLPALMKDVKEGWRLAFAK